MHQLEVRTHFASAGRPLKQGIGYLLVSVARESASQEVKEAWALFVAELLGNVSPSSAELSRRRSTHCSPPPCDAPYWRSWPSRSARSSVSA
jgi:hypothetical protein